MTHNVGRPGKFRKDGLISIISCQRTGNRNHKNWMCKPFLSAVISEKKFAVKINTTKVNTALNKIVDNKVGETGIFRLEMLNQKLPAKKSGIMKANPLKTVFSRRMLSGYRNVFCSGLFASINLPTPLLFAI
ncbi:MAG: hypothetical protein HYZ25_02750 [Chloroflexi bacterium]|nr:hypothetical protein [Chloroflexota bacterium]